MIRDLLGYSLIFFGLLVAADILHFEKKDVKTKPIYLLCGEVTSKENHSSKYGKYANISLKSSKHELALLVDEQNYSQMNITEVRNIQVRNKLCIGWIERQPIYGLSLFNNTRVVIDLFSVKANTNIEKFATPTIVPRN